MFEEPPSFLSDQCLRIWKLLGPLKLKEITKESNIEIDRVIPIHLDL
jgi:hypothetical protein